jgi:hypothetical protein
MSEHPQGGPDPQQPQYPGSEGQQGQPGQPGQSGQPAYPQYGQYGGQYGQQHGQYGAGQYGQYGAGQYGTAGYGAAPTERPGRVLAAAIITWIFSGLSLIAFGVLFIALVVGGDALVDEMIAQSNGMLTDNEAQTAKAAMVVISVIFLIWCAAAIVLAWFTLQGRNWARVTLAVSAAFTVVFSLISISSVISVLTLGAAIAVLALLFTGDANAWFRRDRTAGYYGGYPGGYPAGPSYGQQGQYGQGQYGQGQYGQPGQYGQGQYGQPGQYGDAGPSDQQQPPKPPDSAW